MSTTPAHPAYAMDCALGRVVSAQLKGSTARDDVVSGEQLAVNDMTGANSDNEVLQQRDDYDDEQVINGSVKQHVTLAGQKISCASTIRINWRTW